MPGKKSFFIPAQYIWVKNPPITKHRQKFLPFVKHLGWKVPITKSAQKTFPLHHLLGLRNLWFLKIIKSFSSPTIWNESKLITKNSSNFFQKVCGIWFSGFRKMFVKIYVKDYSNELWCRSKNPTNEFKNKSYLLKSGPKVDPQKMGIHCFSGFPRFFVYSISLVPYLFLMWNYGKIGVSIFLYLPKHLVFLVLFR